MTTPPSPSHLVAANPAIQVRGAWPIAEQILLLRAARAGEADQALTVDDADLLVRPVRAPAARARLESSAVRNFTRRGKLRGTA